MKIYGEKVTMLTA